MTPSSAATTDNSDLPYLDLSAEDFTATGPEIRAAREKGWCARTNFGLAVLRAAEIRDLLRDPRLRQGLYAWPAQNGITDGLLDHFWRTMVSSVEGEDHKRLRRLVSPAFGPRLMEELAPRFRSIANELVDDFGEDGECEFVSAFATPYAAHALIMTLGLDHADASEVSGWAMDIAPAFGINIATERDRIEAALHRLYKYTDGLIEQRRGSPKDDAVSRLVMAHEEGDKLSDDELQTTIATLIFAGMDTTRNQVALAVRLFCNHPDQWQALAQAPELATNAVEEVMRVSPTVLWISREATEDFEFEGVHIGAGTTLHVFPESGGTDPLYVGEAEFDITAERPRQFGFGGGPHHCLGHFLARTDMREALIVLTERLHSPQLTGTPNLVPESGLWGPVNLPVAFGPDSGSKERHDLPLEAK